MKIILLVPGRVSKTTVKVQISLLQEFPPTGLYVAAALQGLPCGQKSQEDPNAHVIEQGLPCAQVVHPALSDLRDAGVFRGVPTAHLAALGRSTHL